MKSAIWFCTWECPYNCPYCWQNNGAPRSQFPNAVSLPLSAIGRKEWAEKWAEAWNRLMPEIMDISGGEPTLLDLPALLERMDPRIKVAITTNLSNPMMIEELMTRFNNERICSWTLSYHPTQIVKESKNAFWEIAKALRQRDFSVTVNLVGYPTQLQFVEETKGHCVENRINFHFDPYAIPPHRKPPQYTEDQQRIIQQYSPLGRKPDAPGRVRCAAGMDHWVVYPNGNAFPCLLKTGLGECLGNVLDEGFWIRTSKIICDSISLCPGCNKDKTKETWERIP